MTSLIWNPEQSATDEATLLARIEAKTYAGREPCAPALINMLGAISRALLNDPKARRAPQYVALGYWLRPSALKRLRDDLLSCVDNEHTVLVPRGIALHLPPTNVDTIFVYSWALSVLAGNANVVRLAATLSNDTQWLVRLVAGIVAEHGEADRHLFCSYAYGGEFEKRVARHCDLRLIWGGDAKVEAVSRTPIRLDGLSIGFPDRKSLALISTASYAGAEEARRDELAVRLYNDTYWFDQMGCASPRLIVWVGDKRPDLSADLYARMSKVVAAKKYSVETGVAIGKFGLANDLLAEALADRVRFISNELCIVEVASAAEFLERTHGGGFLGEVFLSDIGDVAGFVNRKIQTLTHFGFIRSELDRLVRCILPRGGYRIVPIGQALQFEAEWDGVALFTHMTRIVIVRSA